jgi:hypothetical protein
VKLSVAPSFTAPVAAAVAEEIWVSNLPAGS